MGKVKSYLCGFAIGGVVSGIAVMMNTPKSGRELRSDFQNKINTFKPQVSEMKSALSEFQKNVQTFREKGIPVIKSTLSDVQEIVKTWQEDVQPHLKKIKTGVDELNHSLDELEKE